MAMAAGTLGLCSPRCDFLPLKIEAGCGNMRKAAYSGRELLPRLSFLRFDKLELVSCSRGLFMDFVSERGRRGRVGFVVKAQQGDSSYDKEEQRWMREEQRWLREEQRWQREESRLSAVNQALQEEVASLKEEVEELRGQMGQGGQIITDTSLKSLVGGMKTLLQALAAPPADDSLALLGTLEGQRQISSPASFVVEESGAQVSPLGFVSSPDRVVAVETSKMDPSSPIPTPHSQAPVAPSPSQETKETEVNQPIAKKRKTLKSGSQGDEVKELQDALSALGFHSGEEDMEFSTFASGTFRAVKTWQSTVGVVEDGLVTPELMALLLAEVSLLAEVTEKLDFEEEAGTKRNNAKFKPSGKVRTLENKQQAISDPVIKEISKYAQSNAQETGSGSSRRVYLLGENRWEEPDRVSNKRNEEINNRNGASRGMKPVVEKCFSCRGEGTILCTECEGTGDLNVEEQFLEWVEEGAKCPYCEGSGAVQCEICFGAFKLPSPRLEPDRLYASQVS